MALGINVSDGVVTVTVIGPLTDAEYKLSWQAPWAVSVALGRVATKTVQRSFGVNPNVGGTQELVSTEGVATPYMPTAAVAVEIVSDSANDTAAGTGARSVTVRGLDANFNTISQTVNTNGLVAVPLPANMIRVTHAQVETCGTYGGTNTGIITVRQAGGPATTFVTIPAARGRSFTTHYCAPAGYTLAIMDVHIQIESSTNSTIYLLSRKNADTVVAPFSPVITRRQYNSADNVIDWSYGESPIIIEPREDVWFGASAAGAPSVSCEYIGTLEPV